MIETQQSICAWADATFGPPVSDASIAARALVHMARLVSACVHNRHAEKIGQEAADVVIVLARLGRSVGIDVFACVRTARIDQAVASHSTQHVLHANRHLAILLLETTASLRCRMSLGAAVTHLAEAMQHLRINLHAAIDAKMAINRARKWKVDGNGHGSHVKEGA